jgi:hypothetical protein
LKLFFQTAVVLSFFGFILFGFFPLLNTGIIGGVFALILIGVFWYLFKNIQEQDQREEKEWKEKKEAKKQEQEESLARAQNLDEILTFSNRSTIKKYTMRRGSPDTFENHISLKASSENARQLLLGQYQGMIGVSWPENKLYFGGDGTPKFAYAEPQFSISFSQIVEVEVIRDDESITKTNRGSQFAGAAVGALALGGLGAVIGGLSGTKTTNKKVKNIHIKIEMEHESVLIYRVFIFNSRNEAGDDSNSPLVIEATQKVEKWLSLLQRAMKKSLPDVALEENKAFSGGESLENRLEKIWKLKETGALTEAEYVEMKQRLLQSE